MVRRIAASPPPPFASGTALLRDRVSIFSRRKNVRRGSGCPVARRIRANARRSPSSIARFVSSRRASGKTGLHLGLVPLAGLEPARPHGHLILSQARLPIPPQGQAARS